MAGLKYDKDKVRRIFGEGIMRESVIYQEIFQEGEVRGEAKGEAKRLRDLQRVVVGLLDEGLSIATIARLTEFTPEQIQAIGSGQTL
jgi:predicted transposase YdaD